jgi:hypothetical protein
MDSRSISDFLEARRSRKTLTRLRKAANKSKNKQIPRVTLSAVDRPRNTYPTFCAATANTPALAKAIRIWTTVTMLARSPSHERAFLNTAPFYQLASKG